MNMFNNWHQELLSLMKSFMLCFWSMICPLNCLSPSSVARVVRKKLEKGCYVVACMHLFHKLKWLSKKCFYMPFFSWCSEFLARNLQFNWMWMVNWGREWNAGSKILFILMGRATWRSDSCSLSYFCLSPVLTALNSSYRIPPVCLFLLFFFSLSGIILLLLQCSLGLSSNLGDIKYLNLFNLNVHLFLLYTEFSSLIPVHSHQI